MKNSLYRKTYPFEKSVFVEKFIARTVPSGIIKGLKHPYGRKLEGRVFIGEIRKDYFRIVTSPDIWDIIKHPWGIRKVPIWKNPSCVQGIFYEYDGNTVVDYTVDILEGSKFISVSGIIMSCLGTVAGIISMFMEGFHINILLAFVIFILMFISSISALQVHQSEHDALIKFMEDLKN